ncbi:MAG: serine hydrolase [SAR202 cluster bacterium]|nr:serine hydrolase [SAR202 cluster bacterium]
MTGRFPTAEMDAVARAFPGRLGFYVEDINTGDCHQYAADRRYPTASVCKVTVLIELFRQARDGAISLDTRVRVPDNVSSLGSGMLSMLQDTPELTLLDYARLMIIVSDNIATDTLMGILGNKNINATLDRLGYPETRTTVTIGEYHYRMRNLGHLPRNRESDALQRGSDKYPLDYSSVSYTDSLENNVARPVDMADMLRRMHRGEMVDASASVAMLDIMKQTNYVQGIRKHLRPGTPIAHKSGSSGIIKGHVG